MIIRTAGHPHPGQPPPAATRHLCQPKTVCVPFIGVKAFTYRRVKNDERDCADLADLLRLGRLPEAWIAPEPVRALREITRYRHKLAGQRTSCKDQAHAVLAKSGIPVTARISSAAAAGSGWTGCRYRSLTPGRSPRCAR